MRRFRYNELGEDEPVTITEEELLSQYWTYWSTRMLKFHKSPAITVENCIDNWVIVNWAWEIEKDA